MSVVRYRQRNESNVAFRCIFERKSEIKRNSFSNFSVLNRIKVRLNDTEIRLDYLTNERDRGITLIAKIKR